MQDSSSIQVAAENLNKLAASGENYEAVAKTFLQLWGQLTPDEREKRLGGGAVTDAAELLEIAYPHPLSEIEQRLFLAGLEAERLISDVRVAIAGNQLPSLKDVKSLRAMCECMAATVVTAEAMGCRAGDFLAENSRM